MKDFKDTPKHLKLVLKDYLTILIEQNIKEKIELTNEEWDHHLEHIYLRGMQLYEMHQKRGDVENYIKKNSPVYICESWSNMLILEIFVNLFNYFKKEFPSFEDKNLIFLMHQFGYNAQYQCSFLKDEIN